jgi:ADP-heptose:LPS heptosyltransferase
MSSKRKPRKLLLYSYLAPGDILMLTAAVRDLHKNHPNKFIIAVDTSASQLWENNPYITDLSGWKKQKLVSEYDVLQANEYKINEEEKIVVEDPELKFIHCHYDNIKDMMGINNSNEGAYHFIHGYASELGRKLRLNIPITRFKGDIHVSNQEKSWISQIEEMGIKDNFWIIMGGGKYDYTAKWWDPRRYQQVVDYFKGKILFAQCGEKEHWHPRLKNTINLIGKTDIRQFIRLIYHADGVLCPVTFAMHAAAAVPMKPGKPKNRACVVIAGGREPSQWEAYPHHQYIHTNGALMCCDNGGCWASRCQTVGDDDEKDIKNLCEKPVQITKSLRIPKCLDMITAEMVIDRIKLYYDGGALQYNGQIQMPNSQTTNTKQDNQGTETKTS